MNPQDFLTKAAQLAAQIDPHRTAPNPRVGCILTSHGQVVSQGVHVAFGQDHAERMAYEHLDTTTQDLEMFITLEPCDHFHGKKTPSCSDLIVKMQPKKVWVGSIDPHFKGENIKKLKAKGLDIELLPNKDCEGLNPFFETWITQKKPYITLKIAQSLDGKITSDTQYITNEISRQKVHQMRAAYSAILTTTETIRKDDPCLNCRLEKTLSHPASDGEIIILGKSEIPQEAKIFALPGRAIHRVDNVEELIPYCIEKNRDSLMTECGGAMNTKLLNLGIVDEIQIFTAPLFLGNDKKPTFSKELDLKSFELTETQNLGNDLWMQYKKV